MSLKELAITIAERNAIKNKLPENSLPINPTVNGWSGANVRKQLGASTKALLELLISKFGDIDVNSEEIKAMLDKYSELPILATTPPTSETVGEYIGQIYVNLSNGVFYMLTAIDDDTYTWVHLNTGENFIQSKTITLDKDEFVPYSNVLFEGLITLVEPAGMYQLVSGDMREYLDNLKYPAETFIFEGDLDGYSVNQKDLSITSTERKIIMGVANDSTPYTNSVIFTINANGIYMQRGIYTAYGMITKLFISSSYSLAISDPLFDNGYILIEALDESKDAIFNCGLTDTVDKEADTLRFYAGIAPTEDIKLFCIRLGMDTNESMQIKIIEFPKTLIEQKSFNILSSATWTPLEASAPFNYYTDVIINGVFGNDKIIDCIFANKIKNVNYGIILYSITDLVDTASLRFYTITIPSENMGGVIYSYVKHD